MISTRTHGLIDYSVATLMGALACASTLPRPVRRVLGTAGGFHAGYSALTDYEAGFVAKLGMRQHLALDTAGALAVGAAGLLMRRQPAWVRALLVGMAAAEITVVSLSSAEPVSGPGQGFGPIDRSLGRPTAEGRIGYPPLDTPKPVAEDVWVVDSIMSGLLGAVLPVRMTVIRLPDGGLLLHSPTRFTFALKTALEAIGPIRHLVAPNIAHWLFLRDWQRTCVEATAWAAPGLRQRRQVRRSGLRLDHDLGDTPPADWGDAIGLVRISGGLNFNEIALFHRASSTLVLTDLVMNLEPPKVPGFIRPVFGLFGSLAPEGMPPPYLRAVVRLRADAAAMAAQALALNPKQVIFAHGTWFEADGARRLRRSWRWLLGPAPA
jgi:hypothetical protein